MLLLFLLLLSCCEIGNSIPLECIQCEPDEMYYSDVERQNCIDGRLTSDPCLNSTICITVYYQFFDNYFDAIVGRDAYGHHLLSRRCGFEWEIDCNLLKFPSMDEVTEETGASEAEISREKRMEKEPSLVRICTSTCDGRECFLSSSNGKRIVILIIFLIYLLI